MRATYKHFGNDCIIYDEAICEDNIFVRVRSYCGTWCSDKPEVIAKVCTTKDEAKQLFFDFCDEFEKHNCD